MLQENLSKVEDIEPTSIILSKIHIVEVRLGELSGLGDGLENKLKGLLTEPHPVRGVMGELGPDIDASAQSEVCYLLDALSDAVIKLQNRFIEIIERIQN